MTDNAQELDVILNEVTSFDVYKHPEYIEEAKQAILDWHNKLIAKARIDEIEHIVSGSEYSDDDFEWYEITKEEYCGTKYYSDTKHLDRDERIAELKAQLHPKGEK